MPKLAPDTPVEELRNLAERAGAKLRAVGVATLGELQTVGADETYARLRARFPRVSMVFLYALYGALLDCPFNHLPPPVLAHAREFATQLKTK